MDEQVFVEVHWETPGHRYGTRAVWPASDEPRPHRMMMIADMLRKWADEIEETLEREERRREREQVPQ